MSSLTQGPSDSSRRRFLQLMGASMALASASGCTWDTEEILPLQSRPEGRVPGTTRRYASAIEVGGVAASVLVTSYDGRPIKIEGNPLHPLDRGAASARSQAALLDLYDPDHSRGLVQSFEGASYPRSYVEFDPWLDAQAQAWRKNSGAGLRVLAESSSSLALAGLKQSFARIFPQARWVEWEPCSRAQEIQGALLAYGRALRVQPKLEAADTLLCLDADLLDEHPAALANTRAWAQRRNAGSGSMLRLWVVESSLSLTGANADRRLALRHEQILPFVLALEAKLQGKSMEQGFLSSARIQSYLKDLAAELERRRGTSLLCVGPRQPAVVHAVVHRIQQQLANLGKTYFLTEDQELGVGDPVAELADLVREMDGGAVSGLLILGGNPVYDAPADLEFRRALRKVALSMHLSHYRDETSRACVWHLPRAHALESWGDSASWDGTRCIQQPLIAPLFPRRTPLELLARVCGESKSALELVRAAIAPQANDAQWRQIVHDGYVAGSAARSVELEVREFAVPAVAARAYQAELGNGELELLFAPDRKLLDGRSANNAWLQEIPDAITKMTWGNAACFAASTAESLGVRDASIVVLRVGNRELECAATIVPGQAPGSITLHLGYGRSAAGVVGGDHQAAVEPIGYDAYRLRSSQSLHQVMGLTVVATQRTCELARSTDPAISDSIGRKQMDALIGELVRTQRADVPVEAAADAEHGGHHPAAVSLWENGPEHSVRWGLSIDLNVCTGCNACAVACQAENNVPIVGREQVIRGREMHWLRIDRYFAGEPESPQVHFQPMACQQCEAAPCEQVCPVAATVHSAEGLNDMVYNRCIGTRYCANNCPFKVRRFNYFNYHEAIEQPGSEVQRMIYNPEVTIRHRGVMEKCTFCVQRIQAAKITAKNAARAIRDGEITPACAQTCPSQAIVFGDLADPNSRVAQLRAEKRSYTLLDELHLRPRTSYQVKALNPGTEAKSHGG